MNTQSQSRRPFRDALIAAAVAGAVPLAVANAEPGTIAPSLIAPVSDMKSDMKGVSDMSQAETAQQNIQQQGGLPQYEAERTLNASLTSVGSDSMGDLMDLWVEAYQKRQPKVSLQVVSNGSATAPAALIEGKADLGPMARPMKQAELAEFRSKYGFEPTQIRTAIAAVAVYVSPSNPVVRLSFEDLDAIYSVDRKRAANAVKTWGDLGVSGQLASRAIVPVGVNSESPVNSYFRQQVMLQGKFLPVMQTTVETNALSELVASNPAAIGFGELRNTSGTVRVVPIARQRGEDAISPNEDAVLSGRYPLARYLNIYVVRYPGEGLDATVKDFLQFVLSKDGQRIVRKDGLLPLSKGMVEEELAKLD